MHPRTENILKIMKNFVKILCAQVNEVLDIAKVVKKSKKKQIVKTEYVCAPASIIRNLARCKWPIVPAACWKRETSEKNENHENKSRENEWCTYKHDIDNSTPHSVNEDLTRGAFTYDVRCFSDIFDLPTYPNQMLYYISLFSKIRCSMTYLPT